MVPSQTSKGKPSPTGQCGQVLDLLREKGHVLSLDLTATHAIPEAAARIHDLRDKGFNIHTTILAAVFFRGRLRKRVALYQLMRPEWSAPGFPSRGGGDQ